jgi:threonine synthase
MPGTVVVPTGYGELLYGVAKGFRELLRFGLGEHMPRMCSAEPAVGGPLARALHRNQAAIELPPAPTRAAGIAVTVNGFRGGVAVRDSGGKALLFAEASLAEAARLLAREGLWQEYSGAAAPAALYEARQRGEIFDAPVVAILTSTGLKELPVTVHDEPGSDDSPLARLLAALIAEAGGQYVR